MNGKLGMLLGLIGLSLGTVGAEDWPQWRGADGNGVAASRKAVLEFAKEGGLRWEVALPGRGGSTPVVSGDRIFVTSEINGNDGVVCFSRGGQEEWRHDFGRESLQIHKKLGSGSNPSPVCDGERVYVYYKSGTLAALTVEGQVVWEKNLQKLFGKNVLKWDLGTSPILAGANIVVAVMHTDGESYLVAYDRVSGEQSWKVERNMDCAPITGDSYTTPFVRTIKGVETIVVWGADHLTGHELKTGKRLWTCGGFNEKRAGNLRTVASAVATGGIALVPASRGHFVAGVKLGTEEIAWKQAIGPDSASPAAREGRFYVLEDRGRSRGTLHCLEAETGKRLWKHKLPASANSYYASPLLVGDYIYCVREDGVIFCGRLGKEGLEEVLEHRIEDAVVASPVVVDGMLLVRGYEKLFCFGK